MELYKVKDVVEKCMKEDISTRNSDWRLYEVVCKEVGLGDGKNITLGDIVANPSKYPSFESVSRARRKVQELGLYQATDKVRIERNRQEYKYRKEFA